MALQVVGAGLGRTGTHSLKVALEQLLGGPCYHMIEVFGRPADPTVWADAAEGNPPDWAEFLVDYRAAVDWPASACWSELADAFPDAVVLLSVRDPDKWWKSASDTIFQVIGNPDGPRNDNPEWGRMIDAMMARFTPDYLDEDAAKAAYLAHNQRVRDTIAPDRLVEWSPGDGWEPICTALGVPVPDTEFPHVNTTDDFRAMAGLDNKG